jgi:uncharacterized membrane protein
MSLPAQRENGRSPGIRANQTIYWVSRHWLLLFSILLGLLIGLPFLAPVFMKMGWTRPAAVIYIVYSGLCHQLPQRSFFLFGDQTMYPLSDIQAVWENTTNPLILRRFVGNAEMGWKVAWSDRMVSMYASPYLFGILFGLVRHRIKPLSIKGLFLFLLPMGVDGITHLISDFTAEIGGGFRDSNIWLTNLTNHSFPATFYSGDAFGSFNSWMRILTGILFGLGIIWFFFPRAQAAFADTRAQIERKFHKAGHLL